MLPESARQAEHLRAVRTLEPIELPAAFLDSESALLLRRLSDAVITGKRYTTKPYMVVELVLQLTVIGGARAPAKTAEKIWYPLLKSNVSDLCAHGLFLW